MFNQQKRQRKKRNKERKECEEEEDAEIAEIATETNYYHCHKTCVNYVTPCRSPDKCKQQKQENKPCPIKKNPRRTPVRSL